MHCPNHHFLNPGEFEIEKTEPQKMAKIPPLFALLIFLTASSASFAAGIAPGITAHLAGKAVRAIVFLCVVRFFVGNINPAFDAGHFDK